MSCHGAGRLATAQHHWLTFPSLHDRRLSAALIVPRGCSRVESGGVRAVRVSLRRQEAVVTSISGMLPPPWATAPSSSPIAQYERRFEGCSLPCNVTSQAASSAGHPGRTLPETR